MLGSQVMRLEQAEQVQVLALLRLLLLLLLQAGLLRAPVSQMCLASPNPHLVCLKLLLRWQLQPQA